jgi:cytochrome c peroxidase
LGLGSILALSAPARTLSAQAELGKLLFFDASLSGSGRMSCASCHAPDHAFGPPDGLAVRFGGPDLATPGFRATPGLRYAKYTPEFSFNKDGDAVGGFTWDGRADSLAAQAAIPLLAPHEMANASAKDVVTKIAQAPYAPRFKAVFGADIFAHEPEAFSAATKALETYQREAPEFAPFSSKFDRYLAGQAQLTPAEQRGLQLFNDKSKGNCAACHISTRGPDGKPPLFTDFTYDNVGVPRNAEIPATQDPKYHDLGLCGPDRKDLAARRELCGAFKVPSLRNVATRSVFFHNGRFHTLKEVMDFYVERDTDPAKWYGTHAPYDDVPGDLRKNVNRDEVPYDRKTGEAPRLNAQEIDDIVAFLLTLTDSQ